MSLRQLYTYFSFSIFFPHLTKSHLVFYVPYKSPYLDSTGISVFISFDADINEKKYNYNCQIGILKSNPTINGK